ncbi:hypothetical protein A2966_05110 [Candidatus Roizmanbacteria bacterium RIFCSPLOWO2_01_FULL_41_22]|uniref:Galactose-1-phosphate uridyl transferase N-terminal domain-containing protein n=1 Tax=Candidatus Roizmanbacteria bacterium RIFCSPLOWO2_01_FULL_41_22 TaxID=1802067 RepID=A0A1F7J7V1_9BACT|nr:MAG: hypothetical protein A2966_05110 [Candidatus Roizmanbacteria bacterium RIFCSPLOWO2_01_FULL_41_22]
MSKYVPDIRSRRWVIIAPQRTVRPQSYEETNDRCELCPFCPGHEKFTINEVYREGGGEKDQPGSPRCEAGWKVRVITNKYPITDIHEVIVHSPDHQKDIHNLPLAQVELLIKAYRQRFNNYRNTGQVLIFCNHGERSGASIAHPHSQLVVIPFQINLDTLTREPLNNIVDENKFFHIYCPDFSQWPYEVWIAPKESKSMFGDITDEQITDLAVVFQNVLRQLEEIHESSHLSREVFGYNFYIHPKENWYLRVIPRFIHRAGFELGTGLSVNVVDPTRAAQEIQSLKLKVPSPLKPAKGSQISTSTSVNHLLDKHQHQEKMEQVVNRLKKLGGS